MTPFLYFLAFCMMVTGSINTLSNKAADRSSGPNIYGVSTEFNHPFFQTIVMFLGEILCLVFFAVYRFFKKSKGESIIEPALSPKQAAIFFFPALCDSTASSMLNVGLVKISASSFQFFRSASIIFTALFSVIFLKRKLNINHLVGIGVVICGITLVGIAPYVAGYSDTTSKTDMITGDVLVIFAQVIVATQMVTEEKLLSGLGINPAVVVGLEGMWGFVIMTFVLIAMYFIPAPAGWCIPNNPLNLNSLNCKHFEDSMDAFHLLKTPAIGGFLALNMLSICAFNFCGVSVSKYMSSSHRQVLDTVRSLVIWCFSMGVHWETFYPLQVPGFFLLVVGNIFYNEIIQVRLPWKPKVVPTYDDEEHHALLLTEGGHE